MFGIFARNVNDALTQALTGLKFHGVERQSRNGPVIAYRGPVITKYEYPTQRVLFNEHRNANPVFHLMEALWMIEGRQDVGFVAQFVKRMTTFSDNGMTLHGAYGHRWRYAFGYDQLEIVAKELKENPGSRRTVVAMWNAYEDRTNATVPMSDLRAAVSGGKDVPCNTHIYFSAHNGVLDMTVCNRSNDIMLGCYGANAVHMSMLQEYLAAMIGIPVGVYHQISNDLHLYRSEWSYETVQLIRLDTNGDLYRVGVAETQPLIAPGESYHDFDDDLGEFFRFGSMRERADAQYETRYFNFTVAPMLRAWLLRKDDPQTAIQHARTIEAVDWALATVQWIQRNFT